ncbi:hypothetical protein DP067_01115 [Mycoplasmopsis anatis]|uniref:Uncharacterized protein n=1 Tax=Mycoplasmopsis anatis 1340 TaxID=1034808 RepID=F9QEJ3_9BACT|nr:hypothetical protein [Mycoplasmopsis anatis]AWX69972.1 hypothetical protein DP067_01115 [Mycoplasmopsis anatis]EGS28843.1 hypothetical protein GIG_04064 [Mycoplasmopsis anatis 1340]VEU73598.1 Uncharacterised protein [Mycoplasmopsis anatis]
MKKISKLILKTGAVISTPIVPVIAMSAATTSETESQQNTQAFITKASLLSAKFMDLIELSIKFEGATDLNTKVKTFVFSFLSKNSDIYQKMANKTFTKTDYDSAIKKFNESTLEIVYNGSKQVVEEGDKRLKHLSESAKKFSLNGFERLYNSLQKNGSEFSLNFTNSKGEPQTITHSSLKSLDTYKTENNVEKSLWEIKNNIYALSKISPVVEHAFYFDFMNKINDRAKENSELNLGLDEFLSGNVFTINDPELGAGSYVELKTKYSSNPEKLEKITKAETAFNTFVSKITNDSDQSKAQETQKFINEDMAKYKEQLKKLDDLIISKIFENTELSSLYKNAGFANPTFTDTYKSELGFSIANIELLRKLTLNSNEYNSKYEELKKYTDNLENYKDQLLNENKKLKDDISSKDNELASKNSENASLKDQLTTTNNKNNSLVSENEKLAAENASLKENKQTLTNENNSLKETNTKLTTENTQKESELKHSQDELAKVSTENRELSKSGTIKNVFWIIFLILSIVFGTLFALVSHKNRKLKKELKK